MSRFRPLKTALLLLGLGVALVPAACSLGDGECLRMSDCDRPYQCVEGTCRSDETLGIQPSSGEGGTGDFPDAAASDQ